MISYVIDAKRIHQKTPKIINVCMKAAGDKINTQNPVSFLHTIYKHAEKEIKKIIQFTTASGIKLE